METPALPSLADRVRYYREQRGLTQRGLERALHLKHPIITTIEAGTYHPHIDVVQRLATFFGVCVADLVPCTHHPPLEEAVACPDD